MTKNMEQSDRQTIETPKITQYRNSWAVIIGIDEYQHVPKLENAVNDAKQLAEILRDIGFNEIIELYNDATTKESIMSLFMDDDQLPDKVDFEDRILVFFSGHGTTLTNKRDQSTSGYIIPYNGQVGMASSLIEFNELVQKSVKRLAAKHILFLMDCCFSGIAALRQISAKDVAVTSMPIPEFIKTCTSKVAVQIITAGQDDQLVLDTSIFTGHSPFTGAIIQGLKTWESDLNNDGVLTATELGVYLDRKVSDVANVYGHKQKPYANRLAGDEGGDFVIMVSEAAKEETLEEYRERIKKLTLTEKVAVIKKEAGSISITSLIDGEDVLAISYTSFAKDIRDLQLEIVSIATAIGRMFLPTVKYRITINDDSVFSFNEYGEDLPEVVTIEIPVSFLQAYITKEISLNDLWLNMTFFRKESDTKSLRIARVELDLVV